MGTSQRLILILGGARSGKSTFAERLAGELGGRVLYVATAAALDEEMEQRIQKHKADRPDHWRTLEAGRQVGGTIQRTVTSGEVIVLDCLTLLVTNVLLEAGEDVTLETARPLVAGEVEALLSVGRTHQGPFIIVSNEVGMGVVPPYPLGRTYRDLLGWANQRVAAQADQVYLLVAGLPLQVKG